MHDDKHRLARNTSTALIWSYLGVLVRTGSSFVISIILARILGPEPYGLVAIAGLVVGIGNRIAESGFGSVLIQKQRLEREDTSYVFTLQILMGLTLSAIIVFAAPLLAPLLGEAKVTPVVQVLAIAMLVQTFTQIPLALLNRSMKQKIIQQIQIGSYLFAYVLVGLPMAYSGFGVWSLVWAQVLQVLIMAVLMYKAAPYPLVLRFQHEDTGLRRFGMRMFFANLFSWGTGNLPTLVVGVLHGTTALGLYNRAFMIPGVALSVLASAMQTITLSTYSRIQTDIVLLRKTYLGVLGVISLISFPLFFSMAAAASAIIHSLMGEQWSAAIPLMLAVAVMMPFDAIAALNSPLLQAVSKPQYDLRVQQITFAVLILGLGLFSWMPLIALTWVIVTLAYFTRAAISLYFCIKVLNLNVLKIVNPIIRASALSLFGVVVCLAISEIDALQNKPFIAFILSVGCSACIVMVSFFAWPRLFLTPESAWLLTRQGVRLPRAVIERIQSIK